MSTMREISTEIAQRHGLTLDQLRSRDQSQRFARPRQEAYHAIMQTKRFTTTQVGRFFNRDHSSVISGVRRHVSRIAERTAAE